MSAQYKYARDLPVFLIIGILGSGKTTLIQHLLANRPANERWGVVVNDFGPLTLDSTLLSADEVIEVQGGCLCCSAHAGLQQAFQRMRRHQPDRIFIEPTGLGHPDTLIDTLRHAPGMQLFKVISVITPAQLTPDRWQCSELLRKLVTLSDLLVLNKVDTCSPEDIRLAHDLLESLPQQPPIVETTQGQVKLETALSAPVHNFRPWVATKGHAARPPRRHEVTLPGLLEAWQMEDDGLMALGYRFEPDVVFSRPALNALLAELPPVRAKGLLRMGRNWQLLQLADDRLSLEEYAWRTDSRLLIFWPLEKRQEIAAFEHALRETMRWKPV